LKTYYFDSSAYVKLFRHEPGSDTADQLFRLAHVRRIRILMSYWTINETTAALDRIHRKKEISDGDYSLISSTITDNLRSYGEQGSNVGIVPIPIVILRNSINLINQYHISADDALHLYTAIITKCDYFLFEDKKFKNRVDTEIGNMKLLDISDARAMNILMKELDSD
jgi:predicted nucleic acid-binding protein